jgi:ABC-2 type transport system permease protein
MKTILIAFIGEVRKGLLINWTYKANLLISLLTLGFIFIGIAFFMGGGKMESEKVTSALLGYLIWMYAALAVNDLSYGLRGEINAGTLEQLEMSPAPVGWLLIARVTANLIISSVQITVLGIVMLLLLGIRFPLRLEALPALLLTMVGVLGFGFIIAGAMLVLKQVESFSNLLINALAFMNGTFLPVSAMPDWLVVISKSLPSTQGIVVIRKIVMEGKSLITTWQDGSLISLTLNSAIYLMIGWIIFTACERVAKNRGTLGQY